MKIKKVLLVSALVVLFTSMAFAGSVTLNLTGTPTSAKQGETKDFSITVGATGQINTDQLPASVTLQTVYTPASGGGSSSVTDAIVYFTAPSTPEAGCDKFTSGTRTGECKPAQTVSVVGTGAVTAHVSVPSDLPTGTYTITITGSVTNGMTLPNPMPSFQLEVDLAGQAPTVTINSPANGSSWIYGATVDASVTIDDNGSALTNYDGCYNGEALTGCNPGTTVNLTEDVTDAVFTGSFGPLTQLCSNTFSAFATNGAGSGAATSNFSVHYNFGGFLPPITTAKFQQGRTLPVMFRVNGANGPIATAGPTVKLDGNPVGTASVQYDTNGVPYYQLNVVLNVSTGLHTISISLGDETCFTDSTSRTISINIK